jgi:hypothetical protein
LPASWGVKRSVALPENDTGLLRATLCAAAPRDYDAIERSFLAERRSERAAEPGVHSGRGYAARTWFESYRRLA